MYSKWTVLLTATVAVIALGSADSVEAGTAKLKQIGTIANPAGPIDGFDISFVDQKTQRYYLADRSNKSVDIFDAKTDKFIGSVGGFGRFGHGEQRAHHQLHLALVGMTVSCYRGFHFTRRIAVHGNAMLRGGEQDDTANFGKAQRSPNVECCKYGFNGHSVRREFLDEPAEQRVHVLQGSSLRLFAALGGHPQRTVMEHAATPAVAFDHAVSCGTGGGGIDSQHANPWICFVCEVHGHRSKSTAIDAVWPLLLRIAARRCNSRQGRGIGEAAISLRRPLPGFRIRRCRS